MVPLVSDVGVWVKAGVANPSRLCAWFLGEEPFIINDPVGRGSTLTDDHVAHSSGVRCC